MAAPAGPQSGVFLLADGVALSRRRGPVLDGVLQAVVSGQPGRSGRGTSMATRTAGGAAPVLARIQSAISARPGPPCRKDRSAYTSPSPTTMQTWWVSEPQSTPAKHANLSMAFLSRCGANGPPRCPPVPVQALEAHTPHWASIVARNRGTGSPRVLTAQGALGCSRPLGPPRPQWTEPHNGRKVRCTAHVHWLPLRAPVEPVERALRNPRAAVRGTGAVPPSTTLATAASFGGGFTGSLPEQTPFGTGRPGFYERPASKSMRCRAGPLVGHGCHTSCQHALEMIATS